MREFECRSLKSFKNGVFSGYRTAVNAAVADAINRRDGAFRCLEAALDILLDTYVRMESEATTAERAQWRETYIEAFAYFDHQICSPHERLGGETPMRYIAGHLCPDKGIEARAAIIGKANVARRKYESLQDEMIKEFDVVNTIRHFAI